MDDKPNISDLAIAGLLKLKTDSDLIKSFKKATSQTSKFKSSRKPKPKKKTIMKPNQQPNNDTIKPAKNILKITIEINLPALDQHPSLHKKETEKSTQEPQASASDQHGDAIDQPTTTSHDHHPTNLAEHLQMDQRKCEEETTAQENHKRTATLKPKDRDFRCQNQMERLFREIAKQPPRLPSPFEGLRFESTARCSPLCQLLDLLKTLGSSQAEVSAQEH